MSYSKEFTLGEIENFLAEIFDKRDLGVIRITETEDTFVVKITNRLITGLGGLQMYLQHNPMVFKIIWNRPDGEYISETKEEIEKTIKTIMSL